MNWRQLYTAFTPSERFEVVLLMIHRLHGWRPTRLKLFGLGLIAFSLLSSLSLQPYLPDVLIKAFFVVLALMVFHLALLLVRWMRPGPAIFWLLVASLVMMAFATGVTPFQHAVPISLVALAGYGFTLSFVINVYVLARLVKLSLLPRMT
jgi:hypothetical protein